MRTAEEILDSYYPTRPEYEEILSLEDYEKRAREISILAINEARKEAIEYVASLCTINDNNFMPDISQADILKIIDELK